MNLKKSMAYIRFLNLSEALVSPGATTDLDAIEKQLLNQITLAYVKNSLLLVGDLIRYREYGSQATLHSRLKNLKAHGFIKFQPDEADGRKKFVSPTSKALKYYEKLSMCLEKAIQG